MGIQVAFCQVCQREVHLTEGERFVCPVCSSKLVAAVPEDEEDEAEKASRQD